VISFGIAAALFCGAIALGVYAGAWNAAFGGQGLASSTGAASVSLYLGIGFLQLLIIHLQIKASFTVQMNQMAY